MRTSRAILVVVVALLGASGAIAGAGAQTELGQETATGTVSGTVFGPNGYPIEGATVSVPLAEETYETTTGPNGRFELSPSGVTLPEKVVVVVREPGYLPATKLVETRTDGGVRFELSEGGQRSVVVDSGVTHLGDGDFGGAINSQFQTPVVGHETTSTFELNSVQATADGATLRFMARGVQEANEIFVNGDQVGTTDGTPSDGSAEEQTIRVPPSDLEAGENTLRVETDEDPDDVFDVDDFEISNVQLVLEGVPRDREKPSVEISAPETVSLGASAALGIEATDNNRVAIATLTLRHDGDVVETRTAPRATLSVDTLFREPGTYTVSTQVTDQSGNVRTADRTFSVSNVRVRSVFTEPTIPRPDGSTDVVALLESGDEIDGSVPVTLSVDGDTVATETLDGLTAGANGVQWTGVDLSPGTHDLAVRVDPDAENAAIVGQPSLRGEIGVPPLVFEKVYTEVDTSHTLSMEVGDTQTVAQVRNPLDRPVTTTVSLRANDEVVGQSRSVTIEPGASQRLLFDWNTEPGRSYRLELGIDPETGLPYRIAGRYERPAAGTVSRSVPTEIVRVDTNAHIDFRLWGDTNNVMVTRDGETDEIQSLSIPYSAPSSFPIAVTVTDLDGDVIGEEEVTASGRYGSVSVPISPDEGTEYVRIEVTEQGSIRNFAGQVMMGLTGASAVMGFQDLGDAPGDTYYNSLTYRSVVVAQLSGYPPSPEFVDLQERVRTEEQWKHAGETALDVAGILVGAKADVSGSGSVSSVFDDAFTAEEFVGPATDNVDLDLQDTDVGFDSSDLELTNDVGKVSAVEFESKPAYVSPPTDRTAIEYLDVKATGFTGGDATVEVEYDEQPVEENHLDEDSMTVQYWTDGQWQTASDVTVDPEDDTVEADIVVTDLEGTPLVLVAEPQPQPTLLAVARTTAGAHLDAILGIVLAVFVVVETRRRSGE